MTIKVGAALLFRAAVVAGFVLFQSPGVFAKTFTWQPMMRTLSVDETPVQLPTVTVTGHIDWGTGSFDALFGDVQPEPGVDEGLKQIYLATLSAIAKAGGYSSACTNPTLIPDLKYHNSKSSTLDRWFTAQALYNSALAAQVLDLWISKGAPISLLISGKLYKGYKVYYSDGFSEVWVVNPGASMSSMRLFDNPAPDSLIRPRFTTNNPNICGPKV